MPYPTKCDDCHKEMNNCSMSKFNSNIICGDCLKKEQSRPDYAAAALAVQRISNFKGIGKPSDL